ncbi:MAG: hypothetical protein MUC56_10810 [Thermoanaerobaculales bacterium]|jgi:hypothetical protein|nr:hypothetical protein [Thermoanaerobaculales bacterium]
MVLVGAFPATADDAQLEGLPIVRIVCARFNVFDTSDPATSAWFYRAANSLHIRSREDLIRSVLLFAEGDPYHPAVAAESARLLRSLGFMNPVEITARAVEGGVEVTVETHDQWSLQIGAEAGVAGSRSGYGFEIQEENLLGWGKTLTLGWESDVERDTTLVRYQDPNIAGSRWTADLIYEDRSDGSLERVRVERPFYALETTNAWGGWWESEELTVHLWSDGESVVEGRRSSELARGWYGLRLGSTVRSSHRLLLGWDTLQTSQADWIRVDTGAPYPTPEDLDVSGLHLGFEQIADNFEVLHGFRAWSTQEDVGLGPDLRVGVTFSAPAFGGDVDRILFEGEVSVGRHRGGWLLLGDGWLSGRFDEGSPHNVVAGLQLAAAQIGQRGFQVRLLAEASHELDLDRQLTLGADIGLRGWDPDTFDGTGRWVVNGQWRTILARDVLKLFSVGGVVFADAGQTWNPRVGRDTDGVRADAGVGLLFDLSRFSTTNLLRVEIAWPDDGSGPVVILTGSALF